MSFGSPRSPNRPSSSLRLVPVGEENREELPKDPQQNPAKPPNKNRVSIQGRSTSTKSKHLESPGGVSRITCSSWVAARVGSIALPAVGETKGHDPQNVAFTGKKTEARSKSFPQKHWFERKTEPKTETFFDVFLLLSCYPSCAPSDEAAALLSLRTPVFHPFLFDPW